MRAERSQRDIRMPKSIRIRAAVTPWSHIRMMGEDIIVTQLVLAAGQVLRPVDLGAVAAAGYQEIQVARKTASGDPADRDRTGSNRKQAEPGIHLGVQLACSGSQVQSLGRSCHQAADHPG